MNPINKPDKETQRKLEMMQILMDLAGKQADLYKELARVEAEKSTKTLEMLHELGSRYEQAKERVANLVKVTQTVIAMAESMVRLLPDGKDKKTILESLDQSKKTVAESWVRYIEEGK